MIPKSEVGVLSIDSKNVVELIESAYKVSCPFNTDTFWICAVPVFNVTDLIHLYSSSWQRLSSKVTLTHDNLPDHVRVVYDPKCDDAEKAGDSEGVCDNVRVGQQVSSFLLLFFRNVSNSKVLLQFSLLILVQVALVQD